MAADADDPKELFRTHRADLLTEFIDNRDAVMNPNRDYDRGDFIEYLREQFLPAATHQKELLREPLEEADNERLAIAMLNSDLEEFETRIESLTDNEVGGASLPLELHELSALITQHFSKVEEIILPHLAERLTEEQFTSLLESVVREDTE